MSRLKELRIYVDKKLNKMEDEDKRINGRWPCTIHVIEHSVKRWQQE